VAGGVMIWFVTTFFSFCAAIYFMSGTIVVDFRLDNDSPDKKGMKT
jgi:hypothetical protein